MDSIDTAQFHQTPKQPTIMTDSLQWQTNPNTSNHVKMKNKKTNKKNNNNKNQ